MDFKSFGKTIISTPPVKEDFEKQYELYKATTLNASKHLFLTYLLKKYSKEPLNPQNLVFEEDYTEKIYLFIYKDTWDQYKQYCDALMFDQPRQIRLRKLHLGLKNLLEVNKKHLPNITVPLTLPKIKDYRITCTQETKELFTHCSRLLRTNSLSTAHQVLLHLLDSYEEDYTLEFPIKYQSLGQRLIIMTDEATWKRFKSYASALVKENQGLEIKKSLNWGLSNLLHKLQSQNSYQEE